MSELKISLRAARVNADLTLDEAAKALHTTRQTLMNYEKGETSPTVDKLIEFDWRFPLTVKRVCGSAPP